MGMDTAISQLSAPLLAINLSKRRAGEHPALRITVQCIVEQ